MFARASISARIAKRIVRAANVAASVLIFLSLINGFSDMFFIGVMEKKSRKRVEDANETTL